MSYKKYDEVTLSYANPGVTLPGGNLDIVVVGTISLGATADPYTPPEVTTVHGDTMPDGDMDYCPVPRQ